MPDYGMLSSGLSSFHPLTRNPWDFSKNPGGSSAGAAAGLAAGYGPLHIGTDIGGSIRLPAGWCGVFGLKPSLGRVPIDPPYIGRVAGPMTRSVADAALLMSVLSRPDGRDHMSLPYQSCDWLALERDVTGLRLGLLADMGCGLAVEPQVRAAVEAAARAFAAAGAIVEPMKPFLSRSMLDGVDYFWRMRAWADLSALEAARRAEVLPFILDWASAAAIGPRAVPMLQPGVRHAPGRPRGLPGLRLRAVPHRADPGVCGRAAVPDQRPGAAVRAHRLHGPVQHVGAARGFDQLRLYDGRAADRPADRG